MPENRRTFLKAVGGVSAALAGTTTQAQDVRGEAAAPTPAAARPRPFAAAHFGLELAGAPAGFLSSVEGGGATADVVEEVGPAGTYHKKHLANVKYEDFALTAGAGLNPPFYQWIKGALDLDWQRKDGAVVVTDFDFRVRQRREFLEALLTEVTFPAVDASSRDPLFFTVKIKPEVTRLKPGSGQLAAGKTKRWLAGNFRFSLNGALVPKVSAVDAFTFRQKVTESQIGDQREPGIVPGDPEVSDLAITVPESAAQPFYDWLDDFVVKGNDGADKEKTASLEYLAPNLQSVLFRVDFKGVGIFAMRPVTPVASSDAVSRVKVEMYVEEIDFASFV